MTIELQGRLEGQGVRVGIVVARFNEFVTSRLLEGAKAALDQHGVRDEDVAVVWVPGSFEIPVTAKKMAESRRYDAVICLGAVIKGETDHYQYIASQVARGIAEVALSSGVPVIFGVLTTDTVEQAVARAGGEGDEYRRAPRVASKADSGVEPVDGKHGNNGYNSGVAAIQMANMVRDLGS